MVTISVFKSSPATTFNMQADVGPAGSGGHYVNIYLGAINGPGGTTGSQFLNYGEQVGTVDGHSGQAIHSGNPFLPGNYANGAVRWNEGPTQIWVAHTGAVNVTVRMRLTYGSINESHTAVLALPAVAVLPGAPGTPTVSNIQSDRATFSWTAASPGSSPILNYGVYVSTNSAFSSHLFQEWVGTGLSYTVTGMAAGTTYYMRTRATSAAGTGPYSGTVSFTTAPAAPASGPTFSAITPTSATVSWPNPSGATDAITGFEYQLSTNSGFSAVVATINVGKVNSDNTANDVTLTPSTTYYVRVRAKVGTIVGPWSATGSFATLSSSPPSLLPVPAASGTSVTIGLTPPPGITTVDLYTVERRVQGTATPVTTATTTSNSLTMTGLTPGVTYEYRASATIGTYISPFSAWVARQQPQPSTNPGDFFDGNSNPTDNETFRWTGATNNSTSEVVGLSALNWKFAEAVNGGAGVVTRVVGGYVGDYAARMLVTVSATGAGLRWGQELTSSPSDVVPGATYYGSVFVNPSRTQRLSAEITWLDDELAVVDREVNEGALCPADEWTRISVHAAAPPAAEFALVRVIDVTGAGWSVWLSGESVLADGMMLTLDNLFPYFDGDTEDTSEYTYDWDGAPNNAESTRTIVVVPAAPIIRDPDCPPPPTPPKPPQITSNCIDNTGVWRRYWSMISSVDVSTMLYVLPAIVVHVQSAALRQLRVRLYQAPHGVNDPNAINPNAWISEMVVSYVPANSELILDSVEHRATISVNGSAEADAGHLLYGSNGAPVVWPVLNCGVNYFVSFDTPVAAPVGNQTFEAVLTQRY